MTVPGSHTKIAFGDELRTIAEDFSSGFVPHSAL